MRVGVRITVGVRIRVGIGIRVEVGIRVGIGDVLRVVLPLFRRGGVDLQIFAIFVNFVPVFYNKTKKKLPLLLFRHSSKFCRLKKISHLI